MPLRAATVGRWILLGAAALLALVAVLVVVLVSFVDVAAFKPRIAREIRALTGREAELRGELAVEWLPWLAVTLGEGALRNPPGSPGPTLLAWRELRLGARLVPLLQGRLELDRIRIDGLELRPHRAADGRTNWDDLAAAGLAGGGATRAGGTSPTVAGLELRDALIAFEDLRDATRVQLDLAQLRLGAFALAPSGTTELDARFDLAAGARALDAARLSTTLRWTPARFAAERLALSGRLHQGGEAAGGDGLALSLEVPALGFERASGELTASVVDARFGPAGTLALRDLRFRAAGPPAAAGRASLRSAAPRALLAGLGVDLPPTTDPAAFGRLELDATAALDAEGLRVEPLALLVDDTRLAGRLVRGAGAGAIAEFELAGDAIALGRYLEPYSAGAEPFVFPSQALAALRLRGTLTLSRATLDDVVLEGVTLRLVLDDSTARADGAATRPRP